MITRANLEAMLGKENGLQASPRQRQILFMLAGRKEPVSRRHILEHLGITGPCFGMHLYHMRPKLWPLGWDVVFDKIAKGYRLDESG